MFPFWRCAVLVPELLVYWAKVPVCSAGDRSLAGLGIVSLTRYIGQCPGRHLPDYKLQTSSKSRRLFLFFCLIHYIVIYTSIYRDSPSLASAARALIRGSARRARARR